MAFIFYFLLLFFLIQDMKVWHRHKIILKVLTVLLLKIKWKVYQVRFFSSYVICCWNQKFIHVSIIFFSSKKIKPVVLQCIKDYGLLFFFFYHGPWGDTEHVASLTWGSQCLFPMQAWCIHFVNPKRLSEICSHPPP